MPDGASFRVLPNEAPQGFCRLPSLGGPFSRQSSGPEPENSGPPPGICHGFKFGRALKAGGSVAIADFNTSLVKKNFPSFGTIMICT
jgi:hypothetical protein